jgi:hypothetical protein
MPVGRGGGARNQNNLLGKESFFATIIHDPVGSFDQNPCAYIALQKEQYGQKYGEEIRLFLLCNEFHLIKVRVFMYSYWQTGDCDDPLNDDLVWLRCLCAGPLRPMLYRAGMIYSDRVEIRTDSVRIHMEENSWQMHVNWQD